MVKQTIRIFCRVKPTKQPVGLYELNNDDSSQPAISFNVPRDMSDGFINNKKESYKFSFDHLFDQQANQEDVFKYVTQPIVENVLSGFNGTLFAYGQTGSGKTFTITGGAERYVDRGIIPRTLSYIFEQYDKNAGYVFTTYISYLEIYNESGYDLLDPKHEATKLEDLPKISLLEDNDGNIHLKNLTIHPANNEEEALNLLFLGDTNRMIAETPMNQASTRSHCIFTIHLTVREPDSATLRRSKLHLVDLAGSERVSKTGVGGTLLKEAKYINLSLHYLEQVITALSEKSRSHIPYRNSMMTSVLRDSLGGNCMTSMIATCSVEKKNIDESISTCRFAQRVALIKNDAILNEELDPKLLIEKLKREIQQLKVELALSTGEQYDTALTDEEKQRLQHLIKYYIEDKDEEALLSVGADMRKINYAFYMLKKHCINNNKNKEIKDTGRSSERSVSSEEMIRLPEAADNTYLANTSEMKKLKDLILQRDNEINILVNMLKKEKQRANDAEKHSKQNAVSRSSVRSQESFKTSHNVQRNGSVESYSNKSSSEEHEPKHSERKARNALVGHLNQKNKEPMSIGRQEAFEIFKRDYSENNLIEENKNGLKMRYGDAKKLGEQVNKSREAINSIKSRLEKMKVRRSLQGAMSSDLSVSHDAEEQLLRGELDKEKTKYKQAFNQLKMLKSEIEHMQHLLEKSKMKMQKDFELWWTVEATTLGKQQQNHPLDIKSAWRTPPITPVEHTLSHDSIHKHNENIFKNKPLSSSSDSVNKISKRPERQSVFQNNTRDQDVTSNNTLLSSRHSSNSISSLNSAHSSELSRPTSNIKLTGDQKTDEDILAFMKARQDLMRKARK